MLLAPHRLGFFLAMVVLAASGLWWAAVQVDRATGWLGLSPAMPPTVLHATVMVFGFVPLYFAGFLFTAGPKWLGVPPPSTRQVAPALLAQALGWLLWLAGGQVAVVLALVGLVCATAGLAATGWRFAGLVRRSRMDDRVHAMAIAGALAVGTATPAGIAVALAMGRWDVARACTSSGLWGFVVAVYVTVAHRMIPFFTSSALPLVHAWRPFWVLWLLLGVAGFEAIAPWADFTGLAPPAWTAVRSLLELAAGGVVLWLALAWGLVQSLKVRLLCMLHLGFAWLGIGLVLGGVSQALLLFTGSPVLPLASLHAVTMGCLGSLLLAMVTRVSCGHGGRALVADDALWALFWLLQAATVLRLAATLPQGPAPALLAAAGSLWGAVALAWALRLGGWYGRPRADGRPG
ncbi:MAG: NnrS family protein [Comamonadaceae bacterium]|nr:MAG: NnrS family protein [Comamonadaceae bacterium]